MKETVKLKKLTEEILSLLFTYRRSLADAHEYRHYCEQCNHPHMEKIEAFIAKGEPIHLVLPGFPAKSPNLDKVLGILPDKGEKISLHFLNSLCESIKQIYTPGAQITICSDGHVFADLIEVSDENVFVYNQKIAEIIKRENLISLNMFSLSNVFSDNDFDKQRTKMIENYAQSYDEIKLLIKSTPRELALFNGIKKFLLADFLYLEPTMSKTALRKKVHALTYSVIQRSHAWSSVMEEKFPDSVRLSIHPQPCHFNKLGIYLMDTKNNWLTPWHGVAVSKDGKFQLMKKYQVPMDSAELIIEDGYPSYYILGK
jgi:pyoverdine/dityrosine biosynthesis protein Dit1